MPRQPAAMLSPAVVDKIFEGAVQAVQNSQAQILEIETRARDEYLDTQRELADVREALRLCIQEVDRLEAEEEVRRDRLRALRGAREVPAATVTRLRDEIWEIRSQLLVAREREGSLRQRRDRLERRLVRLRVTAERAEALVGQVTLASQLLSGSLDDLREQVNDAQRRYELGARIILAQEEERRRLARDIHDGPAQVLANAVFLIEVCRRLYAQDPERVQAELERMKQLIQKSLQDVRKIIFNLRPMVLDELGLAPTLRTYLQDLSEQSGVPCHFSVEGSEERAGEGGASELRLPSEIEIAAFRVIQEAVQNALHHAAPNRVEVRLQLGGRAVCGQVTDDGRGFSPEQAEVPGHFGLLNMRERVGLLHGEFSVESSPGTGTSVRFQIPLPDKGGEEA